jgi:hypothetical protein
MTTFRYLLVFSALLAVFSGFAMFVMAVFSGSVSDIADSVYILTAGMIAAQVEEFI